MCVCVCVCVCVHVALSQNTALSSFFPRLTSPCGSMHRRATLAAPLVRWAAQPSAHGGCAHVPSNTAQRKSLKEEEEEEEEEEEG